MDKNPELNEENQENKKQSLKIENEIETKQNSLLDFFDTNILSRIFIKLSVANISEEEEKHKKGEDYKCCYLNCISFSLTSKIFNLISKQTKFAIPIFEQEKIENINFNIYLKLNYFLKQRLVKRGFNNKEELLNNILIYTSENGIYDLIPILILNGADINHYYGVLKVTSLYCSCSQGHYKTSKLLIKNNSNINFKTRLNNNTLLHESCKSGNLKLVKYLIKLGLNINEKDSSEETPLFKACKSGNLNLVKYLIEEKKLDFNIKNHYQETILFKACESGNLNLVKYLIEEKKLDFDIKNVSEETILFSAVRSKNIELIDYLLSLGLNVNHKKNYGQTVLHNCVYSPPDLPTIKHLILKGADLTIKYDGDNILQIMESMYADEKLIIQELQKYFSKNPPPALSYSW